MEKIELQICCGTTCYLLGAADFLKLRDIMPEEWKDCVEVSALPCMNCCDDSALGRAPFVRINGEVMSNATLEKIFDAVNPLVRARKGLAQ